MDRRRRTIRVALETLGAPIDRYLAMNLDGIAVLNDAVGGVSVHGVTGDLAFDSVGDVQRSDLYLKHADTFTGTFRFEKAQVARRAADTALTPTA